MVKIITGKSVNQIFVSCSQYLWMIASSTTCLSIEASYYAGWNHFSNLLLI